MLNKEKLRLLAKDHLGVDPNEMTMMLCQAVAEAAVAAYRKEHLNEESLFGVKHIARGIQIGLERAAVEAAVKDKLGGEPAAYQYFQTETGKWVGIEEEDYELYSALTHTQTRKLYTRPQNIISMPTSDEIKSSVDVLERNRNSDWGKAASEWANRPQASAASQPAAVVELTDDEIESVAHRSCSIYVHGRDQIDRRFEFGRLTIFDFATKLIQTYRARQSGERTC